MEGDKQTIELDCPPGSPRPGDLLPSVIKGTILEGKDPEDTVLRFFGEWTWVFEVAQETWEREVQPIIKPRIEALYHAGRIRWGSW